MIDDSIKWPEKSIELLWERPVIVEWTQQLLNSYHLWMHHDLIPRGASPQEQSHQLFESPFVVVSHGRQDDPILNYGNRAALTLWEMNWDELTRTPSRLTAEPLNQQERAEMLERASRHGFIDNYRGIRISKTGNRFFVEGAIVWNVVDAHGRHLGQAASFSQWKYLERKPVK